MPLSGWVILDKPSGISSAHAVAKVKRLLKPDKIGHAGTLDPLASGILPLALGEATKTVSYMMDASKSYLFTVSWGAETETDDLEGKITQNSDKRPTQDEITALLPQFTGEIQQTPPNYSAIKVDGKRAYELARGGLNIELKARTVRVDSLEILPAEGKEIASTTFLCHCGKGTYIRSLARDMGRTLGCFGHVTMLRRLKVGYFNETQAISLEKLEEMVHKDDLGFIRPTASALDDIPAVSVNANQANALIRGQAIPHSSDGLDGIAAAYEGDNLVAIVEIERNFMKPKRVFNLNRKDSCDVA